MRGWGGGKRIGNQGHDRGQAGDLSLHYEGVQPALRGTRTENRLAPPLPGRVRVVSSGRPRNPLPVQALPPSLLLPPASPAAPAAPKPRDSAAPPRGAHPRPPGPSGRSCSAPEPQRSRGSPVSAGLALRSLELGWDLGSGGSGGRQRRAASRDPPPGGPWGLPCAPAVQFPRSRRRQLGRALSPGRAAAGGAQPPWRRA